MLELYVLIAVTLVLNGVLLGALTWAYRSPRFASRRFHPGPGMQVSWRHQARVSSLISVLSVAMFLLGIYLGFDHLFTVDSTPWWAILLQAVGTLVLYDFIYYFAHRAMHHPKLLRHVHGVHHRARNPSALESLYQHPAELLVGISLLFGATLAIGPVHVYAFALAFFVYSVLNVLVHTGFDTKLAILAPIDFLARKHHVHHHDDPGKNYSSLTPLPDFFFGTLS